jgi:CDP-paratose 2-epimerase
MHERYVLITGGAGFIGTNLARFYLERKCPVHILDNLSRAGVENNVRELQHRYPGRVLFTKADTWNRAAVEQAVRDASAVFHLAAQVAVTTSLENPLADMESNLLGTLYVLEAIRKSAGRPPLIFTSTNKVYGRLRGVKLRDGETRYEPVNPTVASRGAGEDEPLEFLSPYGCSKGSADQYVLDYAYSYEIPACVFRMSCIYGPYQLGSEDQGWVAHFLRQAMKREPVTVYGDGKQVRDLLFVEDLVCAMHMAQLNINSISGQAFNVGGGPENSASLLEVLDCIAELTAEVVTVEWGPERVADQRWYVADTSKIRRVLGWRPQTGIRKGLRELYEWYLTRPVLAAKSRVQVA